MDIEVILTQNDPKLGARGKLVKVSRGFALNFLIPQGRAVVATDANRRTAEAERAESERRTAQERAAAEESARRIANLTLTLGVQAGEQDKLFGAVTAADLAEALEAQGIRLERRAILLEEPIKKLGSYTVTVKVHAEVSAKLKFSVVRKS